MDCLVDKGHIAKLEQIFPHLSSILFGRGYDHRTVPFFQTRQVGARLDRRVMGSACKMAPNSHVNHLSDPPRLEAGDRITTALEPTSL